MSYVVAAYALTVAVLALYALSIWRRQRALARRRDRL
ncbi:MAG TPA: heme exporter protein CcmD [bacterium]|nr:heme exporter protein CcmD [bacterium]